MEAYSKEMRRDVLSACDRGEGTRAVALRFGCSESWVRRVKQERPDLTLQELKDELQTELSRQTLCTALRQLKLTLKKK